MTPFALYRILGNDLPPRHSARQQLDNLRFILEQEPPLEDCEKRWVLNRLTDASMESALLEALNAAGQPVLHIPYVAAELEACRTNVDGLPPEYYMHRLSFQRLPIQQRLRMRARMYAQHIRYLTNVNGARNAALREGHARGATWILPFDGSCFFTAAAWRELREAAARAGAARYVLVPMVRVQDNAAALDAAARPDGKEEPQLGLHRDALESFDERLRYGAMDKSALLHRIGVPGRWHNYAKDYPAWDPVDLAPSPESGRWLEAGWVARLSPGRGDAEVSESMRYMVRMRALLGFCAATVGQLVRSRFSTQRLCYYDEAALDAPLAQRHGDAVRAWVASAARVEGDAILALRELPQALDAVRLLERSAQFTEAQAAALRRWLEDLLLALEGSDAAREACARDDHVGTCCELVRVAALLYVGRPGIALQWLEAAKMRIAAQFEPDGRQPHERGEAAGERLNLELWAALARLGLAVGLDLRAFSTSDGRRLPGSLPCSPPG